GTLCRDAGARRRQPHRRHAGADRRRPRPRLTRELPLHPPGPQLRSWPATGHRPRGHRSIGGGGDAGAGGAPARGRGRRAGGRHGRRAQPPGCHPGRRQPPRIRRDHHLDAAATGVALAAPRSAAQADGTRAAGHRRHGEGRRAGQRQL
ncbi:MAG: hypothetical protein AVDCRST_MAG65-2368, partial [uncultured Solirubrobacteraceae bacterium]